MSTATILADSIGSARMRRIVCPRCGVSFPRWYKGVLHVGPHYVDMERLSGYRLLAGHLEAEHWDEEQAS